MNLDSPVQANASDTNPLDTMSLTLENTRINLTKEELAKMLFPHYLVVSISQKEVSGDQTTFEFEIEPHSLLAKAELEKINNKIEQDRATAARKATEAEDPILGQRICDQSSLGVRVMNAMRANDIETVGDLIQHTRKEVLRFRNMGRVGIKELDKLLREHNLKFKKV